jgi:predicted transcriptional regulator
MEDTMDNATAHKAIIEMINGDVATTLLNLKERWDDEKEYEDWANYVKVLRKLTPKGFKFVKAGKRPFAITMAAAGNNYRLFVKVKKSYTCVTADMKPVK